MAATLHGGYGEGKGSFFSFGVGKMSERSFRKSVSANFVTNIINVSIIIHKTQLFSKGQKLIFIISGVVRP